MCVSPSVVSLIAENIFDNPANKRYVKLVSDMCSGNLSLEELKKDAFGSDEEEN
jgi:hypothetical protein